MAPQLLEPFTLAFLIVLTIPAYYIATSRLHRLFEHQPYPAAKIQFTLVDLCVLIIQFGLTAALSIDIHEENDLNENVFGIFILWAFQTLWWYWGIRALSWNEIRDPLKRLATLGIVCPCVFSWPLMTTGMNILMLPFLIVVLLIPVLLSYPAAWIVNSPEENPPRPNAWRKWLWGFNVAFFLIATPLATSPFWSGVTFPLIYYKTQTMRFRQQMRRTADIPSIQEWMKSINISQYSWDGSQTRKPLPTPPRSVRAVSDLQLTGPRPFVTRQGTLVLSWGGGFGHWGLEVAPKGSKKPEWSSRKYALPLADGAWVWSDDH